MMDLKVYINGIDSEVENTINVRDMDQIEFEIIPYNIDYLSSKNILLFLEDYEIPIFLSQDGLTLKSHKNNVFRESFGYSSLRLFIDEDIFIEAIFNISTNEEKYKNIKDMMKYLLENNERILDLCFSRTKYKSSNSGGYDASFESVISLAETILSIFERNKLSLKHKLKSRLELVKEDANDANFYNINPHDIIDNIEKLYQGYSADYLLLFGKVYSLESIQRESYISNYDLAENQILLGGLVSIKNVLMHIRSIIYEKSHKLTYDKEYKIIKPFHSSRSFVIEDLYMEIATEGMLKRIEALLKSIDYLLNFFKNEVNISFNGYLTPKLTSSTKSSSFYLAVYAELSNWYSLGSPIIGVNKDLTKIRSISKIYELYTLYKIIDILHSNGWKVVSSVEHSFFKNFIPSEVELHKNNSTINIFYEKLIFGFSEQTKHNDLVALNKNSLRAEFNFYNPDFIIKKQDKDNLGYFILDAKYSNVKTLQSFGVLDKLFDKYFSNLAVYDQLNNMLDKKAIKSVNAIHPFGDKTITKWSDKLPKVVPDVSTIVLSEDTNNLNKVLDLINN